MASSFINARDRDVQRSRFGHSSISGHAGGSPGNYQDRAAGRPSSLQAAVGYGNASSLIRGAHMAELKRPSASLLSHYDNDHRSDVRSSGALSGHGAAGSRSMPPGARAGGSGRPATPTDRQHIGLGGLSRRDEPGSRSGHTTVASIADRLVGNSALDGGRDLLPGGVSVGNAGGNRSRSVAASRYGAVHANGTEVSTGSRCGSGSVCDKCDGKHPSDRCPFFHKDREKHKDAWVNYGRRGDPHQMGASGGNFVLRRARVVRQPGDGSCLFHSLNNGLNSGGSASSLRREIASFLQQNPTMQIAGDTLEEWVRWDSCSSVNDYARRIAISGWGGGIEMACCSLLKHVNVHVYENFGRGSEFKRISCFDAPSAVKTVHVLYQGGVHYDALQPLAN